MLTRKIYLINYASESNDILQLRLRLKQLHLQTKLNPHTKKYFKSYFEYTTVSKLSFEQTTAL